MSTTSLSTMLADLYISSPRADTPIFKPIQTCPLETPISPLVLPEAALDKKFQHCVPAEGPTSPLLLPEAALNEKPHRDSVIDIPAIESTFDVRPVYNERQLKHLRHGGLIRDFDEHYYQLQLWILMPPCLRNCLWTGPSRPTDNVIIPKSRNSISTVAYLGLKPEVCEDIWATYNSIIMMLPPNRQCILDQVFEYLDDKLQEWNHSTRHNDGKPQFKDFLTMAGFTEHMTCSYIDKMNENMDSLKERGMWNEFKWHFRQRYWLLETAGKFADDHRKQEECKSFIKPNVVDQNSTEGWFQRRKVEKLARAGFDHKVASKLKI